VFFDVRSAVTVGATDWVLSEAVGYSPYIGFTRPLPWSSWRLAAVAGGPIFADLVIAATTDRPLPPAFSGLGGAYEVRVRELARLWVAAMAAVTPAAFANVIREYRRLRTADARGRRRKMSDEPTVNVIESLLLTRSVSRVTSGSSATGVHLGREGVSDGYDRVGGTTRGRGGESAGSGHQARPTSSERIGPSARRTHAA
jgi:hypothetical protein